MHSAAQPQPTVARCVSEGMLGFAFWLLTSQCALVLRTFDQTRLIDSSKHSLAHAAGYGFFGKCAPKTKIIAVAQSFGLACANDLLV